MRINGKSLMRVQFGPVVPQSPAHIGTVKITCGKLSAPPLNLLGAEGTIKFLKMPDDTTGAFFEPLVRSSNWSADELRAIADRMDEIEKD